MAARLTSWPVGRLAPGPKGILYGLTVSKAFRTRPLEYLTELGRDYPDIAYIRFGWMHLYWIFHPDLVREVLVTKAKSFQRGGRQVEVLAQWDGNGLVLSDGDFWLRQRRLVQPAFSPRRFGPYAGVMVGIIQRMLDCWESDGNEVELVKAMTDLTMEIIARTMFGVDLSADVGQIGQAVGTLSAIAYHEFGQLVTRPLWLPTAYNRRKRAAMRYLGDLIGGIIRERRTTGTDRGDLLSMILLAVDEEGDGSGMTDTQARDEVMTLFLAGHDTTAGTLPWVWYELARHPEIEAKVVEEVERVLHGRVPTAEDLPQLRYTEMVIKETLRLYPQAWGLFARIASTDMEVGGYQIRKGGLLYPTPWVTHRDARWFPEPERFDPERFAPGRIEQMTPYAWYPFGGGPRVCIGQGFAMMEMVLTVAMALQRFRLSLVPGQQPVGIVPLLSLRPKGGLRMRFTNRTPALTGATA